MRSYKRYPLLFILAIMAGSVLGQGAARKDSINALAARQLSAYLSLSSDQEQTLLVLEQQWERSRDSLGHLTMNVEQRTAALSTGLQRHFRQVKTVMTDVQWAKYTDMLATRRAAFLKAASGKKMIVTELP
jgi:hypothetical protein